MLGRRLPSSRLRPESCHGAGLSSCPLLQFLNRIWKERPPKWVSPGHRISQRLSVSGGPDPSAKRKRKVHFYIGRPRFTTARLATEVTTDSQNGIYNSYSKFLTSASPAVARLYFGDLATDLHLYPFAFRVVTRQNLQLFFLRNQCSFLFFWGKKNPIVHLMTVVKFRSTCEGPMKLIYWWNAGESSQFTIGSC